MKLHSEETVKWETELTESGKLKLKETVKWETGKTGRTVSVKLGRTVLGRTVPRTFHRDTLSTGRTVSVKTKPPVVNLQEQILTTQK